MELILTKKQKIVLDMLKQGLATEILYGGAAGGGKSWMLRAIAIIFAILVPGVQVFLFRRKVKRPNRYSYEGPIFFSCVA